MSLLYPLLYDPVESVFLRQQQVDPLTLPLTSVGDFLLPLAMTLNVPPVWLCPWLRLHSDRYLQQ